jgi:hypothetical protein
MSVLWPAAAALAVLAALHGASRSAPSSGFDLVLRSIEDQDPIVTIEGDVDLTGIDAELRQQLPGEIRKAAPDLFLDRDAATLYYRNIRATVADVQFATIANSQGVVAVLAKVLISADRERVAGVSRAGRRWKPDGNADLAVVELAGRLAVVPSGGATLKASALLDQIHIQIRLHLFHGLTLKISLGGREVVSRSFDVAPSTYVPAGTTITSFSVLAVEGKTARVRVVVTLPPADASTPDSSASDAGVPDTGTVNP